jgi:hypothetical protein
MRTVRFIPASRIDMMSIKCVLVRAPEVLSALRAAISFWHAIPGRRAKKSLARSQASFASAFSLQPD